MGLITFFVAKLSISESENFTFEQIDLCGEISVLSTSIQQFKPDVILIMEL